MLNHINISANTTKHSKEVKIFIGIRARKYENIRQYKKLYNFFEGVWEHIYKAVRVEWFDFFYIWFVNGVLWKYQKFIFFFKRRKFLFRINTMNKKLLDVKILKKQNRMKNKVIYDFYGKLLKLKEKLDRLEVAKREVTRRRKGFLRNNKCLCNHNTSTKIINWKKFTYSKNGCKNFSKYERSRETSHKRNINKNHEKTRKRELNFFRNQE